MLDLDYGDENLAFLESKEFSKNCSVYDAIIVNRFKPEECCKQISEPGYSLIYNFNVYKQAVRYL